MLIIKRKYFVAAFVLFILEVVIALLVRDRIIRPYGGDFLVVLFLYCLLKSFTDIPVIKGILIVVSFAILVECLQYLNLVQVLGLHGNAVAITVLGTSFEWMDILVYLLGASFIYFIEKYGRWARQQKIKKEV